jgi:anti-anti-sigma regulatory factor
VRVLSATAQEDGLSIPVTEEEAAFAVHLPSSAGIASAQQLRGALCNALASGKSVRIEVGHVTELDVTTIQLLWAAARQAKEQKSQLSFAGNAPGPVEDVLRDLGLEHLPAPN